MIVIQCPRVQLRQFEMVDAGDVFGCITLTFPAKTLVAALVAWGHTTLGKESFIYPVAVQNIASRRIAENLHGEIIGTRKNPKYDSVVYRIPFSD